MRRRNLLATLGGALGAGLAGCSNVVEDDDSSTVSVPTVNTSLEADNHTGENFSDLPTVGWNDSELNDSEWNDSEWNDSGWNDSELNDSEWNDSDGTVGFNETEFELCPGPTDEIEVVNHSLAPGPNETYYVEGTVRNDASDTLCSYVVLEVMYPDDRRETDSLFMGDLDPEETGYFILGPIDLSDADPDSVGYNIYVTNESLDDD